MNLLRNRGGQTMTGTTKQFEYETTVADAFDDGQGGASSQKDSLMKIVLMLAGALILFSYERYNLDSLGSQLAQTNSEKTTLAAEIKKKQPIAENAKKLQKEIQSLEARIKTIKDLAKFRLREIKALDYIQNIIPERLWLTKLNIKDNQLTLVGASLSEEQLNKFLDSLEGKSFFKNVILLKAVEQKTKDGTLKSFEISSELVSVD